MRAIFIQYVSKRLVFMAVLIAVNLPSLAGASDAVDDYMENLIYAPTSPVLKVPTKYWREVEGLLSATYLGDPHHTHKERQEKIRDVIKAAADQDDPLIRAGSLFVLYSEKCGPSFKASGTFDNPEVYKLWDRQMGTSCTTISQLKDLAKAGNPYAAYFSYFTTFDNAQAKGENAYMLQAAEAGIPQAQRRYYQILKKEANGNQNQMKVAGDWLWKAVGSGLFMAAVEVSIIEENSRPQYGISEEMYISSLLRMAEMGDAKAQYNAAVILYLDVPAEKQDEDLARYWLNKAYKNALPMFEELAFHALNTLDARSGKVCAVLERARSAEERVRSSPMRHSYGYLLSGFVDGVDPIAPVLGAAWLRDFSEERDKGFRARLAHHLASFTEEQKAEYERLIKKDKLPLGGMGALKQCD